MLRIISATPNSPVRCTGSRKKTSACIARRPLSREASKTYCEVFALHSTLAPDGVHRNLTLPHRKASALRRKGARQPLPGERVTTKTRPRILHPPPPRRPAAAARDGFGRPPPRSQNPSGFEPRSSHRVPARVAARSFQVLTYYCPKIASPEWEDQGLNNAGRCLTLTGLYLSHLESRQLLASLRVA